MDPVTIKEIMQSLKLKNSEGYDRIPQRIIVDGAEHLITAYPGLFNRIYSQVRVPEQWLISKTIHKINNLTYKYIFLLMYKYLLYLSRGKHLNKNDVSLPFMVSQFLPLKIDISQINEWLRL